MENKVLEKNLDIIKKYDKNLADKILMFDVEKSNILITKTAKDEYNLIYKGINLHNNQGAENEADEIALKIKNKENKNSIRLIYGLGLGYLADSFAKYIKEAKIIVYEPNIDILKFVLSIAQIDAICQDNVIICQDEEMLSNHVKNYSDTETEMTISFLSSYKKLYYDDILKTLNIAQKAQGEHIANKNTLIKKAPGAYFNTFLNLKNIFKNPDISDLKDIYKGKTALCCSAGPSLKENIELIKNNQDKFVIFAVNPTVKLLTQNGIKPDFIVAIETINMTPQFSLINPEEYYFILEGFCYHVVSSYKTKKTFNYLSNDNFLNPWVRDCLKLKNNLETLGTVSYSTVMSAFIMGFDRIILCGQDLAYKNGECYAKGSQYDELECVYDENEKKYKIQAKDFDKFVLSMKSDIIKDETALMAAKNYIDFLNKNLYTVKSQDGKDIPTQTGYALFIQWFEKMASELKIQKPDIKLINTSSGGAMIKGWENKNLNDIISNLAPIEKLDLTSYEPKPDKSHIKEKTSLLINKMSEFLPLVNEFLEINEKLYKELEIKKTFTINAEKLLKKQKNALEKILKANNDKEINFVSWIYIYNISEILKQADLNNIQKYKETLLKTINYLKYTKRAFNSHIKGLRDSESVIFQ